jgi:Ca2+-binding EF-hand superfamily protein
MIDFNEFKQILELKMSEKEKDEEVNRAYELFVDPDKQAITFESLKRIAEEIEENISDEELMAMIKEANKGSKVDHVNEL